MNKNDWPTMMVCIIAGFALGCALLMLMLATG